MFLFSLVGGYGDNPLCSITNSVVMSIILIFMDPYITTVNCGFLRVDD